MKVKLEIIDRIKEIAKELANEYDTNMKIEINVNTKDDVIKINIMEYNL